MGKPLSLVASLCLIANLLAATARPQTEGEWMIDTIAGGGLGDNGPAVGAFLRSPSGVAVDAIGNLYIADSGNNRIRRVDTRGTVTTFAGTGSSGYTGDGGPAVQAQLDYPTGVAVDATGGLYIADSGNLRIRLVDPKGIITTVAGTGKNGHSGDGGPAVQAQLDYPTGVAVDAIGHLYIATGQRIRRVDPSGTITTVAGTGEVGYSGDGGPAVEAQLFFPEGVAVDRAGNLLSPTKSTNASAGWTPRGPSLPSRGPGRRATAATVPGGRGAAFPAPRRDGGRCWQPVHRRWPKSQHSPGGCQGIITTTAGMGMFYQGYGGDNGPAVGAFLDNPAGVAVDATGNLYIADLGNNRIRRVDATGTITTVAGTRHYGGDGGPAVALI